MKEFNIIPVFTPANCTDYISPVDHHIGATIKQLVAAKYEDAFDKDEDAWLLAEEGGLREIRRS